MLKNKKLLITIIIILLALLAISFVFYKKHSSDKSKNNPVGTINNINYSGPTSEESKAGDQQKKENVEKDKEISGNQQSATASVLITDATQYDNSIEVRAFISNVYEEGICTAVFTKTGSSKVTTQSNAFKDVSNTQCGANDTPRASFGSTGDWQLTLTYTSKTGITGSATKTVTIR